MHRALEHPTILAIIVLAFAIYLGETAARQDWAVEYGVIPTELIAACSSLMGGDSSTSTVSELLTTVSALFLHGSPQHVLMNCVFLWLFGSIVSQHLGKWWALGCFLVCGVGGFALHAYMNRDSAIPCIGASGSVSGMEGIYLGMILQWTLPWPNAWPLAHPIPPMQLAAFALLGIGLDLYGIHQQATGIAFAAHIGGFVTGLIIAGIITHCVPTAGKWKTSKWYV